MEKNKSILLFLVTGNAIAIARSLNVALDEIEVVKVDEKIVSSPKVLIEQMTSGLYAQIWFGCDMLEAHRFGRIQKAYLLLAGAKRGGIVDESGAKAVFSVPRFFLIDIPLLCLEAVASILVAGWFHFVFWRDNQRLKKAAQ